MSAPAITWLNGRLLPAPQALVPVNDRGFLYGDGVFETVPVYAGRPFLLQQHLQRLVDGALALRFAEPPAYALLEDAALQVVQANGGGNGVLRLALSRGALGAEGLACTTTQPPTLAVLWSPPRRYAAAAYVQGVDVHIATTRHPAPDGVPTSAKHANYLASILALDEARRAGAAEALLLGPGGTVVEAATSNLFVVHGGRLLTPPLHEGPLPGITRATVLALATALGITAAEDTVTPRLLAGCSEIFLTNALAGVLPVRQVAAQAAAPLGPLAAVAAVTALATLGSPGPITRQLFTAYWAQVRAEAGPPWPDVTQAEGELHDQAHS